MGQSQTPDEEAAGRDGSETRDIRLGQVLNDFLDQRARGQAVSEAEFLEQHPDLADELREHLNFLRPLDAPSDTIEALVAQRLLSESKDRACLAELGVYKITGFLGRGGMGIVLEALDESMNRTVALKLLRPELVAGETAVRRFALEARAAGALNHPNIVTVYSVSEANGCPFLVMEHVCGTTLAHLIRERKRLPATLIRRWFSQLLAGLAAAHKAGLVHRDIKSSNLLLANAEHPDTLETATLKIADFGLARILTAQTRMTMPRLGLGYTGVHESRAGAGQRGRRSPCGSLLGRGGAL